MCWGNQGHSRDIALWPMFNAVVSSVEAASLRHEHDWKVWQNVKLADDKVLSYRVWWTTKPRSSNTPTWKLTVLSSTRTLLDVRT